MPMEWAYTPLLSERSVACGHRVRLKEKLMKHSNKLINYIRYLFSAALPVLL